MAIPRVAPGTVGIDAALGRGKASILDSGKRLSARAVAAAAMLCLAAPATAGAEPPALLVVLAVDQLRAGYIETYGHQWHAGLRRLIDDGAWFENAAYPYRATVTCAGHATIATGSFPARHGMVGNSWWDRADAAQVTCTTDASQTPIAYGGQASERHGPAPLRTATLADVLRAEASGQSRVVSMSLKPRSAITLAGQAADAVTWFDAGGVWATSTAYSSAPVDAVWQFVAAHPVEQFAGEAWERLLPPGAYLHDDDGLGESPPAGWNARFPHPFGEEAPAGPAPGALDAAFYSRWRASPHSDEYLGRMAGALIEAFELGAGDRTDYLAIGFSAVDYIGHRFGPRSHEVQDALVRLDRTLGRLLETLDARVGRGRYVVALSADHGVSPVPEQAAARGVDAGRLDTDGLEAAVRRHCWRHASDRARTSPRCADSSCTSSRVSTNRCAPTRTACRPYWRCSSRHPVSGASIRGPAAGRRRAPGSDRARGRAQLLRRAQRRSDPDSQTVLDLARAGRLARQPVPLRHPRAGGAVRSRGRAGAPCRCGHPRRYRADPRRAGGRDAAGRGRARARSGART